MPFARFLSKNSILLDTPSWWCQEMVKNKENERKVEGVHFLAYMRDGKKRLIYTQEDRREAVLEDIADLLAASGKIGNECKLHTALVNNERRFSCGIGRGLAIPHARCMQTKNLVMCLVICQDGVDFNAADEAKVQILLGMVAPPYDDRMYLRFYRWFATVFESTDIKEKLLSVRDKGEVIRILDDYYNNNNFVNLEVEYSDIPTSETL